ncbi:polyphosphate kinase [Stakelama sp. CBK3Z-3]|uniref:Polyphosphate kinase n=1 Tax=Stakelama flava TaxID=2860338 RepID=A0ABS6XM02_9SPHN|nr:polyphosphate kinase [Stakelama flava]MBW4330934.1 polyphosphate kinase [Stakelama flava]
MTIDLGDYEIGAHFDGDYSDALKAIQKRLAHIQVAHIVRGRAAMVVLEGWDAAGKGGAIKRMTAEWDPRYFEVWPIAAPSQAEKEHHFLWRFWQRLPAKRNIAVFDRSWYGRVLVERVEGYAEEAEWRRAYDEINEFEAQQADCGISIVKLFLHITQAEQDDRLRERIDNPWKQWKTGADDFRNRARREAYCAAMHDMFAQTDTRWAPWTVIDANNKKAARIAALTAVTDQLEAHVCMDPPDLDPELYELAEKQLGKGKD